MITKRLFARLNYMAQLIREKGQISFEELCLAMDFAPSTCYNYIRILVKVYPDIKFKDGICQVVKEV